MLKLNKRNNTSEHIYRGKCPPNRPLSPPQTPRSLKPQFYDSRKECYGPNELRMLIRVRRDRRIKVLTIAFILLLREEWPFSAGPFVLLNTSKGIIFMM